MLAHIQLIQEIVFLMLTIFYLEENNQLFNTLMNIVIKFNQFYQVIDSNKKLTSNDIIQKVATSANQRSFNKNLKRIKDLYEDQCFDNLYPFLHPELRNFISSVIDNLIKGDIKLNQATSYQKRKIDRIDLPIFQKIGSYDLISALSFRKHGSVPFLGKVDLNPFVPAVHSLNHELGTTLVGHSAKVFNLTYDNPGKRLITGCDERNIKVWDVRTGYLIFTLKGHSGPISDFGLCENINALVSCDILGFIVIWDLRDGKIIDKCQVPKCEEITSIFFTPYQYEGIYSIVATTKGGAVYLYGLKDDLKFNKKRMEVVRGLAYKKESISCGTQNKTGTIVAFGGDDYMINLLMPKLITPIENVKNLSKNPKLGCLKWGSQRLVKVLYGHCGKISSLDFNKEGDRLLSCSEDCTVRVWNYCPQTNEWTSITMGRPIDFSKTQGKINVLERDFEISPPPDLKHDNIICSATWANNDELVVVSYLSGKIRVFCSYSGVQVRELNHLDTQAFVLESHPVNSSIILCASYGGQVVTYNCVDGLILKEWSHPDHMYLIGQFSPLGHEFALSAANGEVQIFTDKGAYEWSHSEMDKMYQAFDQDFVCVPPHDSFPTPGTQTYRNSFKEYILRNLLNKAYSDELQKPASFGLQYTAEDYYRTEFTTQQVTHRFRHYQWPALREDHELPKKSQYQRFRKAHKDQVPSELVDEVMNEPLILPPSPQDPEFVPASEAEPSDDYGSDINTNESLESDSSESEYGRSRSRRLARGANARRAIKVRNRANSKNQPSVYGLRSKPMVEHNSYQSLSEHDDSGSEEHEFEDELVGVENDLKKISALMSEGIYPLSEDVELSRPWVKLLKQEPGNYFPQVGDDIVYLRSGHQEFYDSLSEEMQKVIQHKHLPFVKFPQIPFEVSGVVKSVRYKMCQSQPIAIVKLNLGQFKTVTIELDSQLPRFIVEEDFFKDTADISHSVGSSVILFNNRNPPHTIDDVSDKDDPWNRYRVGSKNFGAWELTHEVGRDLRPLVGLNINITKAYLEVIQKLEEDIEYLLFRPPVDLAKYPSYIEIVAHPMFLEMIKVRLDNGFYRTEEAIHYDMELISQNTRAFNKISSPIAHFGARLLKEFKEEVNRTIKVTQLEEYDSDLEEKTGASEEAFDEAVSDMFGLNDVEEPERNFRNNITILGSDEEVLFTRRAKRPRPLAIFSDEEEELSNQPGNGNTRTAKRTRLEKKTQNQADEPLSDDSFVPSLSPVASESERASSGSDSEIAENKRGSLPEIIGHNTSEDESFVESEDELEQPLRAPSSSAPSKRLSTRAGTTRTRQRSHNRVIEESDEDYQSSPRAKRVFEEADEDFVAPKSKRSRPTRNKIVVSDKEDEESLSPIKKRVIPRRQSNRQQSKSHSSEKSISQDDQQGSTSALKRSLRARKHVSYAEPPVDE